MYLFSKILVIFLIIYVYLNFYNNQKIQFLDVQNTIDISLKNAIKLYHANFHKKELLFKTSKKYNILNTDSNKGIRLTSTQFYINNFIRFTNKEKDLLKIHIKYINKLTLDFPCIVSTNWKFIKFSNILEKNMPFTLDQYIFLPEIYINGLNSDISSLVFFENCNILLHEQFHIIQRNNQYKLNKIYPKIFGCIRVKNIKLNSYWKSKYLSNPDCLDINWIYKFNNSYYLPLLTFNINNRSIKEVGIKLIKKGNIFHTSNSHIKLRTIYQLSKFPRNISVSHPNEIMAYILPKIILGKNYFRNKKINQLIDYVKLIN